MSDSRYFFNNLQQQPTVDLIDKFLNDEQGNTNSLSFQIVSKIIDFADCYGFTENIWQAFWAFAIISSENAFSLACEWKVDPSSTTYSLAQEDLDCFFNLFNLDLNEIDKKFNSKIGCLANYKSVRSNRRVLPTDTINNINKLIENLQNSTNPEIFTKHIALYYNNYGVGNFGLFKAFRLDELNPLSGIKPISNAALANFSDLVGYDNQKQKLTENTENFVEGRSANNVLLFGDSGTGKSTSIKAVLNEYCSKKLRMIEIYKHQFAFLPAILREIKHRNYWFIIYMDDLSFEDNEIEYKYLKAIIEGGLEVKPNNVLIYATSNRRHIIREQWKDRVDVENEDVHRSDTMEEKLSLAHRFGINIFYPSPNSKEFKEIVSNLAVRNNIVIDEDELLAKAHRWEMRHGGLSGRTAQQFINYVKGNHNKN